MPIFIYNINNNDDDVVVVVVHETGLPLILTICTFYSEMQFVPLC